MAKQETFYTLEILPENIIFISFEKNLVISKNHITSIFDIIKNQLSEYPIIVDISNIEGIDYEAINLCSFKDFVQYTQLLSIIYNPKNISKKYTDLLITINKNCKKINKSVNLSDAILWTTNKS